MKCDLTVGAAIAPEVIAAMSLAIVLTFVAPGQTQTSTATRTYKSIKYSDLPKEAKDVLSRLKCDVVPESIYDAGTAADLNDDGSPEYGICCYIPDRGACSSVLVGKIGSRWEMLLATSMYSFNGFEMLESRHGAFHDLWSPNSHSEWWFLDGRYRPWANGALHLGANGMDPKNGEIPGRFEAEVTQCLNNLVRILHEAKMSLQNDVVSVHIDLTDMRLFPRLDTVYSNYFGSQTVPRPTLSKSNQPGTGLRIEVSANIQRYSTCERTLSKVADRVGDVEVRPEAATFTSLEETLRSRAAMPTSADEGLSLGIGECWGVGANAACKEVSWSTESAHFVRARFITRERFNKGSINPSRFGPVSEIEINRHFKGTLCGERMSEIIASGKACGDVVEVLPGQTGLPFGVRWRNRR